jgi:hypothetical protein
VGLCQANRLPKGWKRSYEDIKMELNERMHESERAASQEDRARATCDKV